MITLYLAQLEWDRRSAEFCPDVFVFDLDAEPVDPPASTDNGYHPQEEQQQ